MGYDKKQKREKTIKSANKACYAVGVVVANGNIEGALKKFKKLVKDTGILTEFYDRQEFLKPSIKERETKKKAIRRNELNKLIEQGKNV